MNILHIFQALTGDAASVGVPVTLFFTVLFSIFFLGSVRRAKESGGVWWKQNMAKFLIPVVVFWLGSLAWIWSDYRPYNPKKDGVPKVQTDSTRISAEEIIDLQEKGK